MRGTVALSPRFSGRGGCALNWFDTDYVQQADRDMSLVDLGVLLQEISDEDGLAPRPNLMRVAHFDGFAIG
jgi:hypothetical protein